MSRERRQILILTAGLLLMVLMQRLALLGEGALTWVDEQRYLAILRGVRFIQQHDFASAINSLFSQTHARPGMALALLLPAGIQVARESLTQVSLLSPGELLIPTALNALWSTAIVSLVLALARRILPNNNAFAFACAGVFAATVPSYFYTRHLVPYYPAEFLFLLTCWVLLSSAEKPSSTRSTLLGILSGATFATYPGYYLAVPAVGATIFLLTFRTGLRPILSFLLGCGLLLLLAEATGTSVGVSYIGTLSALSGTVTIGDFNESFLFLPRYLKEVDGWLGVAIGAGSGWCLISGFFQKGPLYQASLQFRILIFSLLVIFLAYAALGYFFHYAVFYGRLLLPLYAFLVILAGLFLYTLFPASVHKLTTVFLIAVAWSICAINTRELRALAYPRDAYYRLGISVENEDRLSFHDEINRCMRYHMPSRPSFETLPDALDLVNFCDFYPAAEHLPTFSPAAGSQLIFSAPHFLNYPAYRFEGLTPKERALLSEARPEIKVYRALR